jgi:multidrug resistance efflux pump
MIIAFNPKSKIQNPNNPKSIEPRSLKITLNVTKPEHIKVKPGDEVAKGQIIADRPEERAALLAKKTQLEIAIKQATLGLATTPPPAPNFQAQEEALRQSKANIESQILSPGFQFIDRQLQEIFEPEKIAQENQTKQRKLEKAADIEASLAKLQEAKAEYQQQLGQYQQQRERQQYELNSLQVQLAEVEVELGQVSAVRSPYSGTVKKVKVKGQAGNQMEVEVTVVPREE